MNSRTLALSLSCTSLAVAASTHAALFAVNAPATPDGVSFSGIVDTSADTFTLHNVVDGAAGNTFWTISSPVVMHAVDSAGLAYDVPNAWDGTIDSTWGFVGPLLSAVAFNEGAAPAVWSTWSTGWGAYMGPDGTIQSNNTHDGQLQNWVYTSGYGGQWVTQAGHGLVNVTLVPAPGSAVLFGVSGLVGMRRRR